MNNNQMKENKKIFQINRKYFKLAKEDFQIRDIILCEIIFLSIRKVYYMFF